LQRGELEPTIISWTSRTDRHLDRQTVRQTDGRLNALIP